MAKNSRAAGLYEVAVEEIDGRAVVSWRKNEAWRQWAALNEGCYLLRTNVADWSAEDVAAQLNFPGSAHIKCRFRSQ
jgi:hypothetical protein